MNRTQRLSSVGRAPDADEWSAIVARRAAPSNAPWFLVVVTTGIVCRPGCPARTPLQRNVRIVGSVAEGVAAGARPCLRCRPDGTAANDSASFGPPDEAVIAASVLRRLEQSLEESSTPPSDGELAAEHDVSERRLREILRAVAGVTPRSWLAARRAERLRAGLAARRPVLDALLDAGYESASAAYDAAASVVGMAPGAYRTGGAGEVIRWTVAATSIGQAMVAATERGLCAVKVGDDVAALESELRAEFPRATITRDDASLAGPASLVADLAAGYPRPDVATIPLDLAGTAFRRRVWEALRSIPRGETRTYQGLAVSLGMPKAARAVGSACATNPLAIVVPCHRVVGSDGELHGYRWGLDRKRRILEAERSDGDRRDGEPATSAAAVDTARAPGATSPRRALAVR